ncbi:transcriptional regulatory protein [Apiospora arundinis]|uniref:Transcriptional regulatory protein n=1 Tax=Apiospora arundinis TaxID=335852 RepID=A0ABR2J3P6_9PEZI
MSVRNWDPCRGCGRRVLIREGGENAGVPATDLSVDNVKGSASIADVVNKITTLEAKIENMGSSLQRIERCLVSLLDGSDQGGMGLPAPSGQVEGSSGTKFPTSEQRNRFEESQNSDTMKGDFGLPEEVFMAVIDSYFTYCQNQPYSFFHEQNFRQRLSKQDIPRHLVLAVMATAVRFCSHPCFTGRELKISIEYANRSWKLIVSDCFTVGKAADVSAVQTILRKRPDALWLPSNAGSRKD